MTPEQKQQILDNAPEGATHYADSHGTYYKKDGSRRIHAFGNETRVWWSTSLPSFASVGAVSLASLREPEQAELKQLSAQQKREKILRLALEYISADPENHDAQSIVKDHIDTAKKALAHAASIPDENWSEEEERRMDVIPQNGNDGDHYAELEEYIAIQNGIDSGPFKKAKAHEVAQKWAKETPGKPAAVCHVLAVYQGKVEVERVK